jgi:hypothetical protein
MSAVVIAGDTSGSITLAAPAVAGTTTLTLPATSGTVITSASSQLTGPAFRAYRSTNQSINNVTVTKIIFDGEDFDTNSNYDTSNGRFTPTVAGYYQINAGFILNTTTNPVALNIKKNTTTVVDTCGGFQSAQLSAAATGSICLYMNGSTDYVEVYAYHASGSAKDIFGAQYSTFSACMVRAA